MCASSLRVVVRNRSADANRVGVTVADTLGAVRSRNHWEDVGETQADAPILHDVPPFARAVRLDLSDSRALRRTHFALLDGAGAVRARIPANLQPGDGWPVGAASHVRIDPSDQPSPYRLVFDLTL